MLDCHELRHNGTMSGASFARALNESCQCITLDEQALDRALSEACAGLGVSALGVTHPHLFSRSAVFVEQATLACMREVVAALERVVNLPSYRALVLGSAPAHARVEGAARGAFLGFDFHLSERGPQLIEINTNAGGGLLNALLRRAQRACCAPVERCMAEDRDETSDFVAMIAEEWRLARPERALTTIALVDDAPEQQYLHPEFLIFQRAAEAAGYRCLICDARELVIEAGQLWHAETAIDLVYNRLTDFWLEAPAHAALARAFREDLAVVTPHPRAYALYADKYRLALLSDGAALRSLGVAPADVELLLAHVPETLIVSEAERERLARERAQFFFKPQSGYGSKAAYRGDKLTKRVFAELFASPYVAQRIVAPSQRVLRVDDQARALKLDVRCFAYAGRVQLTCARLYQGQTTNFRSQGGGFAPVYVV
jgi:hypothetical protein